MSSHYLANIFSITNLLLVALGAAIAIAITLIYGKLFRKSLHPLYSIKDLSTSENDPLYTLLNNLPDNVYIKDTACRYIMANDKFAQQLKFDTASQLIGKSDFDIYPPEIAQRYVNEDNLILNGEKNEFTREQKSEKDGTWKYTVTTKMPLKNKSGKIIGLVGIFTDITDQKVVYEKLQNQKDIVEKERKLLRTLIDSMPDAIYIKDSEGKFLDANPTQISITKAKSRREIINKSDYDFYPKDIADIFAKDDKQIIETGQGVIGKEEIGFDIDGNIRVRSTTKVPFYNEDGEIAGLVGIGRDITKLKETEEKLIEQAQNLQEINVLLEERQEEINQQADELNEQNEILERERTLLRTIIDSIPDYIYIKDKDCRFITGNKHLLETLKLDSLDKVSNKTNYDFFPAEVAEKFLKEDKEVIAKGKPIIGIEESGVDKDGNVMYVMTSKVPIKNAHGEIEGIVGYGKDITSLKETELKLQEQANYLKEVNVLLEERQEEIQQQSSELSNQNILLENERNLLKVLIDNIPESIFIKDTEGRFVIANKNVLKVLNVNSLTDLEGKTDFDFFDRNTAQEYYDDEQKIMATHKAIINKEEIRRRPDSTERIKSISKVPYYDEDNRVLGIVGISKDITDLKLYQQQLQKQASDLQEANQLLEERAEEIQKQSESLSEQNEILDKERNLLRTLIDHMPDHIYIKDAESRFITLNKRLLSTMHVESMDYVIGKTDFEFAPNKEAAEEYYKDEQEIVKTGRPLINKEEIGFDEYGKKRSISTTKVPFFDVDGNILGIVGIGRDITKQKNNEQKLIQQAESLKEVNSLLEERQEKIQIQSDELNKQAEVLKVNNEELKHLNATKNKFFSIIAHDLKNPFQAIFGFSELLMRNFDDFDEKQRVDLLSMIKTSSESAYNLLENLLQWARTQTDRIKYNPAPINIHDLIEQNITLSLANTEKKSIAVKTELECNGMAWADFNMINLVIRNLLSNAIKFTGMNGLITIKCKDYNKNQCIISIADTGIGISEENIQKLYKIDEYFSTTGTSGETGTGLGLIICKEFIEKNHGKLIVESTLNVGTSISFTLPLRAL